MKSTSCVEIVLLTMSFSVEVALLTYFSTFAKLLVNQYTSLLVSNNTIFILSKLFVKLIRLPVPKYYQVNTLLLVTYQSLIKYPVFVSFTSNVFS